MTPLTVALVKAVLFLLRKQSGATGHRDSVSCHCYRCALIRDLERESVP